MAARFWRAADDGRMGELTFVGAVASAKRLYVIVEGPPAESWVDDPPMLWLRVVTASGRELTAHGASGGTGPRGREFFFDIDPPAAPEALSVTLFQEDGTAVGEVRAEPAG